MGDWGDAASMLGEGGLEGAAAEGFGAAAAGEGAAGTAAAEAAAAGEAGAATGVGAGAASSGIPSSLITAAERNAAQQLLTTGKIDPTKLVTGVATGAATGALGNEINANLPDNIDPSIAKYIAPAAIAAATGKDPLKAIEGTAAGDALNEVPGFSDLPIEAKNAAATAVMSGGDPRAIVNSLKKSAAGDIVDSVTASQANATNTPTEDQVNQSTTDFVKSLEPYKETPAPADDGTTAGINDTIQQLQGAGLTTPDNTGGIKDQSALGGEYAVDTTTPAPVNDTVQQLQDSGLVDTSSGGSAWDAATSDPNYGGQTTDVYANPVELSDGSTVYKQEDGSYIDRTGVPVTEDGTPLITTSGQDGMGAGGGGGGGGSGGPTKPVTPTVTPKPVTPTPKPTTPTPTPAPAATGGTDVNTLLALLGAMGGQQQAAAPVQDPYAHIKSYKDIFGHEFADDGVFAKTEQNTAKAATGGSVDDLLKLLGI